MRIRTKFPSAFETLIDDMADGAAGEEPPGATPALSIDSLEAAWELVARNAPTAQPPVFGYDASPPAAFHPDKTLEELGLDAQATESDIQAIRREFARRNHPDRLPVGLRELATQRMSMVNAILDRELLKRKKLDIGG